MMFWFFVHEMNKRER